MYINLNSVVPYIGGEPCGFININNYDVVMEDDDYEKYQEYKENGIFNDPSFLALPYIEDSVYRELQNRFLEKYFPRKSRYFRELNHKEFEHYFHITIHDNLLVDDWFKYEDEFRIKLLQEWCENNNIRYSLKKTD